ncbi:MAG TPA: aspartate/glutamate racemase family protein [Casimicrobiaceae bacterium]|nr:aspartate/glutamate racemase family protein [Casimicrobiaceae bacterium]
MNQTIFVMNPNSLQAVTDSIDAALAPLRRPNGPALTCLTLAEGPPGIQTQRDVEAAIPPLVRKVTELAPVASGFVVACFSDPGLHALREITLKPVIGIGEAGILTALTLGQRVGVIAILAGSIPRHLRYYAAMGVLSRIAGELPVGLGVAELTDRRRTLSRMMEVGRQLCEVHGADVLVMGCAGMASLRGELQHAVGVPVVEPCQAGVATAIGRVQLDWHAAST